jgi:hypothetical protein
MTRTVLRYPLDAARPTIAYQLILRGLAAAPNIVETPTIGYPFELTQLTFSSAEDPTTTIPLTLLLSTNPYVGGDSLAGYILHRITGDFVGTDARNFPYLTNFPLTLRPRIRVPQAGYRIRLVRPIASGGQGARVLLILTPLD